MGWDIGSDGAYNYLKPVGGAGPGQWAILNTVTTRIYGPSYTGPNTSPLPSIGFNEANTNAGVYISPGFSGTIPNLSFYCDSYQSGSSKVNVEAGRLQLYNSLPANTVIKVLGANSQAGNLQEWTNSSGAIYARINASGEFLGLFASGIIISGNIGNASVVSRG